jgi:hypothetical protein
VNVVEDGGVTREVGHTLLIKQVSEHTTAVCSGDPLQLRLVEILTGTFSSAQAGGNLSKYV